MGTIYILEQSFTSKIEMDFHSYHEKLTGVQKHLKFPKKFSPVLLQGMVKKAIFIHSCIVRKNMWTPLYSFHHVTAT